MKNVKCKSCDNQFNGNYCNNCGEKEIKPKDRTLKHLLSQIVNAFTFADGKFLNTLKSITLRPGRFSKDYVEGKRVKYMTPVSIFFLANLIYFLFPLINTFTTSLYIQTNSFSYRSITEKIVEEELEQRNLSYTEFEEIYNNKTAELSRMLLIVFVFMLCIWNAFVHIGSKRKYFADHLVFSFELMTFTILIVIQFYGLISLLGRFIGVTFLGNNFYTSTSAVILLIYFYFFGERNFYQVGYGRAILNVLLSIFGYALILMLYRFILFFVTIWAI
jgi:hypothetical protein